MLLLGCELVFARLITQLYGFHGFAIEPREKGCTVGAARRNQTSGEGAAGGSIQMQHHGTATNQADPSRAWRTVGRCERQVVRGEREK